MNISNHTITKKVALMLKHLLGFSRESEPRAHTRCTKPCSVLVFDRLQSANCRFSCTIFGIYISHTERGLARRAVLSRQCSLSNEECAQVCHLRISLSLSLSLVSFYFRLFVLLLRAPVHSSFHLRRRMLPPVLGADPCLFTGAVYAVGLPALFQLVRCCFNILQGHLC